MKVSYNWLKSYLDFPYSAAELSEILTQTGLEVEGLEAINEIQGGLEGVVIGEVLTCEPSMSVLRSLYKLFVGRPMWRPGKK
jgi:phenylalanyl-tRNA synthetase beta chain